jgi:hypothetical protein
MHAWTIRNQDGQWALYEDGRTSPVAWSSNKNIVMEYGCMLITLYPESRLVFQE